MSGDDLGLEMLGGYLYRCRLLTYYFQDLGAEIDKVHKMYTPETKAMSLDAYAGVTDHGTLNPTVRLPSTSRMHPNLRASDHRMWSSLQGYSAVRLPRSQVSFYLHAYAVGCRRKCESVVQATLLRPTYTCRSICRSQGHSGGDVFKVRIV